MIKRIGVCENAAAQLGQLGARIEECPAMATHFCTACLHALCGAHASGHAHPSAEKGQPAGLGSAGMAAGLGSAPGLAAAQPAPGTEAAAGETPKAAE